MGGLHAASADHRLKTAPHCQKGAARLLLRDRLWRMVDGRQGEDGQPRPEGSRLEGLVDKYTRRAGACLGLQGEQGQEAQGGAAAAGQARRSGRQQTYHAASWRIMTPLSFCVSAV